jgi:phage baseplate assembly protein gpV
LLFHRYSEFLKTSFQFSALLLLANFAVLISYSQIKVQGGTTITIGAGTDIKINANSKAIFQIDSSARVINNGIIELGENTSILEFPGFTITGEGFETASRAFNSTVADTNIAGLGFIVSTTEPINSITVRRGHQSLAPEIHSVNRWFDIIADSADIDIKFIYDSTELNSPDITMHRIFSSSNGTTNWQNLGGITGSDYSISASIANHRGFFTAAPFNIILATLNKDSICAGDQLEVEFELKGLVNASNKFIIELSDFTGSFVNPISIDTIEDNISRIFLTQIPDTLPTSNQYRLRIKTTDAPEIFQIASLTILQKPNVAITSEFATICENGASINLSITPTGGTLSGTGIENDLFNPLLAGEGIHDIEFYYADNYGCFNVAKTFIEVFPTPAVAFSLTRDSFCFSDPFMTLEGLPSGGLFSGNGISENDFFPSEAGSGTHTLTYTFISTEGCSNSESAVVFVKTLPEVFISGLESFYCENDPVDELQITPLDAVLSGSGISNNFFNPLVAGSGNHTIAISYSDINGCSNFKEYTTQVFIKEDASLSTSQTKVCVSGETVELNGIPFGGTYLGMGVENNLFIPSIAGSGIFELLYIFVNSQGCSDTATFEMEVLEDPELTFEIASSFCEFDTMVVPILVPTGGAFSGNGVINDQFNPITAGPGNHTLSYFYADSDGCSSRLEKTISVFAKPVLAISAAENKICASSPPLEIITFPSGGNIWGNGVSNEMFYPADVMDGIHQIFYAFTDLNGCSDTATFEIEVLDDPVLTFEIASVFCENDPTVSPQFIPAGGNFSGNGTVNFDFNPQTAGAGNHTLVYSYTNSVGCSSLLERTVSVFAKPILIVSTEENKICASSPPLEIITFPSGGNIWGNGVSNEMFYPADVMDGIHQIFYAFTDVNGCSDTATFEMEVLADPVLTFDIASVFCENDPIISPQLIPSGGTFSGNGTVNFDFDPQTAGPGNHLLTYFYESANGCANEIEKMVTVFSKPIILFELLEDTVCYSSPSIILEAIPIGGIFQGTGVLDATFNPEVAGSGSHSISYIYSDSNGCSDFSTKEIYVRNPITILFDELAPLCENEAAIVLKALPQGGYFSGPGVESNEFNPSTAQSGTHILNYYLEDSFGCYGTASQTAIVYNRPDKPEINQNGNVLETNFTGNYQWFLNGSPIFGATERTFKPVVPGAYSVIVFNSVDCFAESNVFNFTVNTDDLLIYPNPSPGNFKLKFNKSHSNGIEIFLMGIDGRILSYQEFKNVLAGEVLTISTEAFANGQYVILIKTEEEAIRRTIIKAN